MATVQERAVTEKRNGGGQTVTVVPQGLTTQNVGVRTNTESSTTPEHTVSQTQTQPAHVVTQEQKSHAGLTLQFTVPIRNTEPIDPAAEGASIAAGPDCP